MSRVEKYATLNSEVEIYYKLDELNRMIDWLVPHFYSISKSFSMKLFISDEDRIIFLKAFRIRR